MKPTDERPGVAQAEGPPRDEVMTGDAALVAGSLSEPEVFSLVYERHALALYRFAHRRLGPDLEQDAMSDAILQAFRGRHRYDQPRADARRCRPG
ncbi:hypothetical protein Kisp01_66110 [Kineosporia sp. NBRC 101677]|uniref:RNA polymerase sigma factor n=1 Tax=Kineosporia sp. NBRC 101677 TaxID=3032197 RepID=UPI0024A28F32|nr:hypothetical protein [Kineosporia sp. NBRC 101677]GLY19597.1 hypothetical protein Kisp01_66110 [Kineosporia sp. NBRC 101677]